MGKATGFGDAFRTQHHLRGRFAPIGHLLISPSHHYVAFCSLPSPSSSQQHPAAASTLQWIYTSSVDLEPADYYLRLGAWLNTKDLA